MRQLRFKAKVAKQTVIPDWLVEFFRRLDVMIQRGDEAVVIPCDDCIQEPGIVGGLIKEHGQDFQFSVFPGPDNPVNRPRWDLVLCKKRIRGIADGKVLHLNLWECANPSCMKLFSDPTAVCIYCDYEDEERDKRNETKMTLFEQTFNAKEEWALAYLTRFPEDHPMQIIGQYNSTGLGETLGWFTLADMISIAERFRSSSRSTDKNPEAP